MGHGHGEPYTIPDYKIYKVECAPELVVIQKALAAQGLKDPWIRNEVWRFNPKEFGTESSRARAFFLRGFKTGFAAFLITIAGTAIYNRLNPSHEHCADDHKEHGDHKDH